MGSGFVLWVPSEAVAAPDPESGDLDPDPFLLCLFYILFLFYAVLFYWLRRGACGILVP